MKTMTLATMTAGLIVGTTANAAITYVDIVGGAGGNTVNAANNSATDWFVASGQPNNFQWQERDGGTNDTVYQGLTEGNDPSGVPKLKTTITGLDAGTTYNIWVFFIDNTGDDSPGPNNSQIQNWSIGASLTSTVDTTYWSQVQPLPLHNNNPPVVGANGLGTITSQGVVEASTLDFASDPLFIVNVGLTSERRLYGVNLGQASGSTEASVYIQQLIQTGNSNNRTWYDGVGYEAVPEPSSLALLSLGGLLLARRRRG